MPQSTQYPRWFDRTMVRISWSLKPADRDPHKNTTRQQDIDNLKAAQVRGVQMPLGVALAPDGSLDVDVLGILQSCHCNDSVVRLPVSSYDTPQARSATRPLLQMLKATGLFTACCLGIEVDEGLNPIYGSPTWMEARARVVAEGVKGAVSEWSGIFDKIYSPALQHRGHYHNWDSANWPSGGGLIPGQFRWWEIMRDAANMCYASCQHFYSPDGTRYDWENRVETDVWLGQNLANKPIYIGEINMDRDNGIEQMTYIVRFLTYLLEWNSNPSVPFGRAGERVIGVTPFVFNGNAQGWPAAHRITDIEACKILGRFVGGENFVWP